MALSLTSALERLVQESRDAERRNCVKEKESKKIKAAATLLRDGTLPRTPSEHVDSQLISASFAKFYS